MHFKMTRSVSWHKPTPQGVDPRPFNQHFEEEWSDLSGLNHDILQKPRKHPEIIQS